MLARLSCALALVFIAGLLVDSADAGGLRCRIKQRRARRACKARHACPQPPTCPRCVRVYVACNCDCLRQCKGDPACLSACRTGCHYAHASCVKYFCNGGFRNCCDNCEFMQMDCELSCGMLLDPEDQQNCMLGCANSRLTCERICREEGEPCGNPDPPPPPPPTPPGPMPDAPPMAPQS